VHAARAARLWPAAQAHLFEESFHFESNRADVGPPHPRTGIEIHAQFIRMIEIARAHRMRVQLRAPRLTIHASPAASSTTTSSAGGVTISLQ